VARARESAGADRLRIAPDPPAQAGGGQVSEKKCGHCGATPVTHYYDYRCHWSLPKVRVWLCEKCAKKHNEALIHRKEEAARE